VSIAHGNFFHMFRMFDKLMYKYAMGNFLSDELVWGYIYCYMIDYMYMPIGKGYGFVRILGDGQSPETQ
jgi:hypothetical protein